MWWQFWGSAGWGIWECSSPRRWVSHCGDRAWEGQGAAGEEVGGGALHRQPGADAAAELMKLGGAKVILATVTNARGDEGGDGRARAEWNLHDVGAVPLMEVPSFQLLLNGQAVKGWYSGTSIDSQDTLAFCAQSGVRSMNELFPLEQVSRLTSGC